MTVQELYEIVRKEIDVRAFYDPNYRTIQQKIDSNKANFEDTAQLSRLLSQILGEKLASHILELPPNEGRSELCQQLLKDFFDEINHKLAQVQSSLDKKNGISLNPVQPSFPTERAQNVAGSLNDTTEPDSTIQRRCRNAVSNVANAMHDSFIQVNAKFRNNAGLFVQVTRTGGAECCDWCAQVSGTFWGYNRDLREVFRRHDKCTCTITYSSSKTRSRLVGESDGAGGTTHKWVESQKSWQEKPTLPDVHPTRFTQEQAKRFETEQLRKQGFVRVGDGVRLLSNGLTNSGNGGRIEERIVNYSFTPLSQSAVVPILQRESQSWIDSLTREEIRAIRKYTKNIGDSKGDKFYARLNAMLRGELPEDETLRYYAELISSAIKKNQLQHDIVCYRATDSNYFSDCEIGDVIAPEYFLSTSVSSRGTLNKKFKIIIHVPIGADGAYIEKLSGYPKQREFLLDKDCKYKVVSISEDSMELEVIV